MTYEEMKAQEDAIKLMELAEKLACIHVSASGLPPDETCVKWVADRSYELAVAIKSRLQSEHTQGKPENMVWKLGDICRDSRTDKQGPIIGMHVEKGTVMIEISAGPDLNWDFPISKASKPL